jgi:kumamolisin
MQPDYAAIAGSERVPLPGAVATGRANPHATIAVSLKLRRRQPLPKMAIGLGAAMTRRELGETYGADQADVDTVVQDFEKLGLKAGATNAATRTVELCGTVAEMENAFGVKLFSYNHEGGSYRGRVGALHVPAGLEHIVQGVFGLDNRRVARQRRLPARDHHAHMRLASVPSAWYVPGELASHYNFPAGDGAGQTVGLLEFGGGYFPADLKKFCALAKIPAPPNVIPISTDGTATDSRDGAQGEVMLDVEVIAGLCPKAGIAIYFAEWTEQGWITALDAAVHDQQNDPGVISISWGGAEDTGLWTQAAMDQINETLREAAALGVTVCVAAGDDGSSGAVPDGHAHVDFPASSPYVLAVGGTTITAKAGRQPDIAWKEGDGLRADNGGSTGGGVSAVFPVPAWQQNFAVRPINPGARPGRCIPDLAANADWNASPYLLVVDGRAQPNGGTSAASPLVAGLLTLINAQRGAGKRLGYVTPVLYQAMPDGDGATVGAAGCTDVVYGENGTSQIGGFMATPGYDAVSGWGTPNGVRLASALAA